MQRTAPERYREKIFEALTELEEQRTKEALELVQKKHKLIKWEGERERARTLQGLEASRAIGPWSGAHDNSSFGSCSSFLAFDTDEAMSASSQMGKDAGDAWSESSWTALAKSKERGWWSIDLEGVLGKLEVIGPWSGTEGGSVDPKGEMGYRSPRWKAAREEREEWKKAGMEMDGEVYQEEIAKNPNPEKKK